MGPLKVFLDANVLFSTALGGRTFELLWELERAGKVSLLTSRYCLLEAESNLARKRPERLGSFADLLASVAVAPEAPPAERADVDLDDKDMPVYSAAVAAEADVLLTGDMKHFGGLMKRDDLSLKVRTVSRFLLEGP